MPYRPLNAFPRSEALCTVYLLHFSRPFGHAQHYIGVVTNGRELDERLAEHRAGTGANICSKAVVQGIELWLARTWHSVPRYTELKLKNRGGARRLCPICKGEAHVSS